MYNHALVTKLGRMKGNQLMPWSYRVFYNVLGGFQDFPPTGVK